MLRAMSRPAARASLISNIADQPVDEASLPEREYECDQCSRSFAGDPAGAGLLVWMRGDEIRYEEPPLCEECARKLTIGAVLKWDDECEDE